MFNWYINNNIKVIQVDFLTKIKFFMTNYDFTDTEIIYHKVKLSVTTVIN